MPKEIHGKFFSEETRNNKYSYERPRHRIREFFHTNHLPF